MPRTTSAAGRAAITAREGLRLDAYLDSVGVATIGVGHAATAPTPPAVRMGMTITREQADEILMRDLAVFDAAVSAADPKGRLSQNAHDAAVSLAFNIGRAGFARSTVARKIAEGDMAGAAEAFLLWDKPAVLLGRRRSERLQFLTPDAPAAVVAVDDTKPVLAGIERAINAAAPTLAVAAVPVAPPRHIDARPAPPPPTGWRAVLAAIGSAFGRRG